MNIVVERLGGGMLDTNWTPREGPFTREFVERKLKQRGAPVLMWHEYVSQHS